MATVQVTLSTEDAMSPKDFIRTRRKLLVEYLDVDTIMDDLISTGHLTLDEQEQVKGTTGGWMEKPRKLLDIVSRNESVAKEFLLVLEETDNLLWNHLQSGDSGRMLSRNNEVFLLSHQKEFVKILKPDNIIQELRRRGVLSTDDFEKIESASRGERKEKVRRLLVLLYRRDDHTCQQFREVVQQQEIYTDPLESYSRRLKQHLLERVGRKEFDKEFDLSEYTETILEVLPDTSSATPYENTPARQNDMQRTDLKSLFQKDDGEVSKVLVQGPAGVGKSLLTWKIVSDWSKSKLWEDRFPLVYWFDTKVLGSLEADKVSADALLTTYHGPNMGQDEISVRRLIQEHAHKMLIIFDALDECDLLVKGDVTEVYSNITEITKHSLIHNILQGHLLKGASVLATARFKETFGLQSTVFQKHVRLHGFVPADVLKYMGGVDPSFTEFATAHLESHSLLMDYSYFPFYCRLVRRHLEKLFQKSKAVELYRRTEEQTPETVTGLLTLFIKELIEYNTRRSSGAKSTFVPAAASPLSEPKSRSMQDLCEIAAKCIAENNSCFSLESYERADQISSLLSTGLLKNKDPDEPANRAPALKPRQYLFLHLTLQAYLGALKFVDLLCSVEPEPEPETKPQAVSPKVEKQRTVPLFVKQISGIFSRKPSKKKKTGTQRSTEEEENGHIQKKGVPLPFEIACRDHQICVSFLTGLLGQVHKQDIIKNMIKDVFPDINLDRSEVILGEVVKSLLQEMQNDVPLMPQDKVFLLNILMESSSPVTADFTQLLLHGNRDLDLGRATLSPPDCKALAYFISDLKSPLQTLYMTETTVTGEGLRYLAQAVEARPDAGCKWFYLSMNNLGPTAGIHLSTILSHTKVLQDLFLQNCYLGCEGVKHLSVGLAINTSLNHLRLGYNGIRSQGLKRLAGALTQNSVLKILDLTGNDFQPDDLDVLGDALRTNTGLMKLSLCYTSFEHTPAGKRLKKIAEDISMERDFTLDWGVYVVNKW